MWSAIIVGSYYQNFIFFYSEECEEENNANKCIECNADYYRLESFNGNNLGKCICREGYYDNMINSNC